MEYLIVDGYNVIGAWQELSELAEYDLAFARDKLRDRLINHCAFTGQTLLLVFDAHSVDAIERRALLRKKTSGVIYTKKGETADNYIEKFVRENKEFRMQVVSGDALVQIMIFAHAARVSVRELRQEIDKSQKMIDDKNKHMRMKKRMQLEDRICEDALRQLDDIRRGKQ